VSTNIYVQAFKELIDEVIRENKNSPQRAKKLIVNEILKEAKGVFKTDDYQEIKTYAMKRLIELGIPIKELEILLER